jgi:hypothetical protein
LRYYGSVALIAPLLLFSILFLSACDKANNHLTLGNLSDHFVDCGLKVDSIQPVEPGILKASSSMAMSIEGKEIGIYKYDTGLDVQKKRVSRIADDGFIYIVGLKYPVLVNGSFVMIGAHNHPRKTEIIKAFNSFK